MSTLNIAHQSFNTDQKGLETVAVEEGPLGHQKRDRIGSVWSTRTFLMILCTSRAHSTGIILCQVFVL